MDLGGRGHNSTLSNTQEPQTGPCLQAVLSGLFCSLPGPSGKVPVPKRQVSPGSAAGSASAVARTLPWPWLDGLQSLPGAHLSFLPAASLSSPLCLADLLANLLLIFVLCLFIVCKYLKPKCMLVCLQCPCNCLIGALGEMTSSQLQVPCGLSPFS